MQEKMKMKITTSGGMLRKTLRYVRASMRTVRFAKQRATPSIIPKPTANTLAYMLMRRVVANP